MESSGILDRVILLVVWLWVHTPWFRAAIVRRRRDHLRMVDARYREWIKRPKPKPLAQLPLLQQNRAAIGMDVVLRPGEVWMYHDPYGRPMWSMVPLSGTDGWAVKHQRMYDSDVDYRIWYKGTLEPGNFNQWADHVMRRAKEVGVGKVYVTNGLGRAEIDSAFIRWLYNEIHDTEIPEFVKTRLMKVRQAICWGLQ
jgi:hypothetical protein